MPTIVDVVQKIKRSGSGLTPSYTAVNSTGDTHEVQNNGKVFLHFKKTGSGNAIVTIQTPGAIDGLAIAELTATVVATTGDKMIGPFDPSVYNVIGESFFRWTVDEKTGLSIAALSVDF